MGDVEGLDLFDFDLPAQSQIIGDKAYNDYELEDVLLASRFSEAHRDEWQFARTALA